MEQLYVPSIPMLHSSVLGPHVVSFGVDDGSFAHQLTCDATGTDQSVTVHPKMVFDKPVSRVHATMVNQDGRMIWDAIFNTGGKNTIPAIASPIGGALPVWPRICTAPGHIEQFKVSLQFDDGTLTGAEFMADNQLRPPLAQPRPFTQPLAYSTYLEASKKYTPLVMLPSLTGVASVPISPLDFLPTIAY